MSARCWRTCSLNDGLICKQWDGPCNRSRLSATDSRFAADYRRNWAVNSNLSHCRCVFITVMFAGCLEMCWHYCSVRPVEANLLCLCSIFVNCTFIKR